SRRRLPQQGDGVYSQDQRADGEDPSSQPLSKAQRAKPGRSGAQGGGALGGMSFRLIPLLVAFFAWYGLMRELSARRLSRFDWRVAWILASICWGATLTLVTETASLLGRFDLRGLMTGWVLADIALVFLLVRFTWSRLATGRRVAGFDGAGDQTGTASPTSFDLRLSRSGVAVIVLLLGFVA